MKTLLALLGLLLGSLFGGDHEVIPVPLGEGSVLRLEGGSTVQDWSCSTSSLEAWTHRAPLGADGTSGWEGRDQGTSGLPAAEQAPRSSEAGGLFVPVATLECGNGRMEADLRKAVREDEHPVISFVLTGWELAPVEEGFRGVARGRLTLAGETREVEVDVRGEGHMTSGEVRATGTTRLLMTSFGIRPPSALFGLIKARDEVTVHFELTANRATIESLRGSHASTMARSPEHPVPGG